jgi:hypothetical protein
LFPQRGRTAITAHVHNRAAERWRPRRLARRRPAAEDLAKNVQICKVERCRLGG